jgi:hypothetical protein
VTDAIVELAAVPLGQRENGSCTSGSYAAAPLSGQHGYRHPRRCPARKSSSPKIALAKRPGMALSSCSWPGRALATAYTGLGQGARFGPELADYDGRSA